MRENTLWHELQLEAGMVPTACSGTLPWVKLLVCLMARFDSLWLLIYISGPAADARNMCWKYHA